MENTEPPPPYPGPPLTKIVHLGPETRLSLVEQVEATYCNRHLLLVTEAAGLPTTIYHWKRAEGEGGGKLLLLSVPTQCSTSSLRLVEGLREVGCCTLPPKTAASVNREDQDRVTDLIETFVIEAVKQGCGGIRPTDITTASPESDNIIAWIQKYHLSPSTQPSSPTATNCASTTETTLVQLYALPVFSRSPSVLVAGRGPHMLWGFLKPMNRYHEGPGWCLTLDELLSRGEKHAEWEGTKYAMRLLVGGVIDETYEGMVKRESWPVGIL